MTTQHNSPLDEAASAWDGFTHSLAEFIAAMTDDDGDNDHLILELPQAADTGALPYAQIASFDDGEMLRAEIAGNVHLADQYRLGESACAAPRARGWTGNDESDGADVNEMNWHVERPAEEAAAIADDIAWALTDLFGIAHPQLLVYDAWGPTADDAARLGLCARNEVPAEAALSERADHPDHDRVVPINDRADLQEAVREVLERKLGAAPAMDDDGDFPLEHRGQLLWVRIGTDAPAVQLMARVARNVRSRRSTAVELAVLNADNPWVRWNLRDRDVWQTAILPGRPFVPAHLSELLDVFYRTLDQNNDNLRLRTGGKRG